jgi:putative oxidoreductase
MTLGLLLRAWTPLHRTPRLDLALLMLRVFIGVAFWFHGSGKVVDVAAFAAEFQIPPLLAMVAAYTQVAGALLLIAGLLTPAAALALAATMGVAMMQLITRGERFVDPGGHSWEAAAFYFVANVVLVLAGPGRWSIDAALSRWPRAQRSITGDRTAV